MGVAVRGIVGRRVGVQLGAQGPARCATVGGGDFVPGPVQRLGGAPLNDGFGRAVFRAAVQAALQEAYENGQLRGNHLIQARKVIEKRRSLGRTIARGAPRKVPDVTSSSLIRTYQHEVERQKLMVKKTEFAQQRLLFVAEAMRQLMANENFTNLLRAEGLDSLPKYIAERVWPAGSAS